MLPDRGALLRAIRCVKRDASRPAEHRMQADHQQLGHAGHWYRCQDAACRRASAAAFAELRISDEQALEVVRASSDDELLAMRNLGKGSLAILRAWAGTGPVVPNWVGEGVPA